MPNRLAAEKSPYLRQHAHNPVDWFPWGDGAFATARARQVPIFLSIGYTTCHWCHVMERESFENVSVAEALNRDFVAIKVDREERPDVDRIYMAFVQATTGSGGWPMSVWLTPDLEPFYGGTYFPPQAHGGRPGFSDILREVARAWREERERLTASATSLLAQLAGANTPGAAGDVPGVEALASGVHDFAAVFDTRHGGFGRAPKFPRPSELLFLLREHARTGDRGCLEMVSRTLQAMACGGMRDHLGGGFHRYSVDGEWRVPHFEKMLYDQAQLVVAYLEAFQATGDCAFADVADDTLAYVVRDLTNPDGAFFAAEDADSVPPRQAGVPGARKTEGAFYLWSTDDVAGVLGAEDAALVCQRFGILPDGNAPFDPHHEFGRGNLLWMAADLAQLSEASGLESVDVSARLDDARQRLLRVRAARPRPERDEKVLAGWNGLMIAACARAGRVLGLEPHTQSAARAARFVRAQLWDAERRVLWRRWCDGERAVEGFADDYAGLVWGLLELFQADGNPEWLAWAIDLQRAQDDRFLDVARGGWFSTTGSDPSVRLRLKEDYDGAEPSASALGAHNLLMLAGLTGDQSWRSQAEAVFAAFSSRLRASGRVMPLLLGALSVYHAGGQQLAIVGDRNDSRTQTLVAVAARRYLPSAVVLTIEPGCSQAECGVYAPWVVALVEQQGRPTAYWCRGSVCTAPVTEPDELAARLAPDALPTS